MYNSHLKAWDTSYPLHENLYKVHGNSQDRFVWDVRCMASLRLPWDMNFQATGRYNSRSVTAQGTLEADWDVEAGVRKRIGAWDHFFVRIYLTPRKATIFFMEMNTLSLSVNGLAGAL